VDEEIVARVEDWVQSQLTAPYRNISMTSLRQDEEFATVEVRVEVREQAESDWGKWVAQVELKRVGNSWRVDIAKTKHFVSLTAVARETQAAARATATSVALQQEHFRSLDLFQVQMLSNNAGWALGSENKLLYFDGSNWKQVKVGIEGPLSQMSALSRDEVWFRVGDGRTLAHYKGGQWTELPMLRSGETGREYILVADLQMLTPGEGWAIAGIDILRYTSATDKWDIMKDVPSIKNFWGLPVSLAAIKMFSPEEGVAMASNGGLLYKAAQDKEWRVLTPSQEPPRTLESGIRSVSIVAADDIWLLTAAFNVLHFADGKWEQVELPVLPTPTPATDAPPDTGIGAGAEGTPKSVRLRDIEMLSAGEGWGVGDSGAILHYSQGVWQVMSSPVRTQLYSVSMFSRINGWAVGAEGVLLNYDGTHWAEMTGSAP
jgi:hypothetical protein